MGLFGKAKGQACYKCGKLEKYWVKCHLCSRVVCGACSIDNPAGEFVVCQDCDEKRADDYHQKKYAEYVWDEASKSDRIRRRRPYSER